MSYIKREQNKRFRRKRLLKRNNDNILFLEITKKHNHYPSTCFLIYLSTIS